MNIPKGYKQTELGIIPEDWEVKHISDFTSIVTGGTPSTQHPEYWGGDIRWMSSGELNHKFIHDVEGRITQEGLDNSSTHIIPAGCVLIGLAGQGKTRGTAAYNFVSLCTNQSIAAFLPTAEHSSLYLYYVIDCKYEYLRLLSSGDGGRGGLNKKLLSSLNVVIPPLPEQKAIAKALSDVDDLIAALDKKIAKKRLIKQGAMQQLLTGKTRLPGFTDEWVETSIGTGIKFQVGFPFQSQYFTSDKVGKRLVKNRDLKSDDQVVYYVGTYNSVYIVQNGDILIGMDGDFIPCKWNKGVALLNQRVGRLIPYNDWNLTFIMYALIVPLMTLQDGTGATTVKHLSHNDIERMVICMPSCANEQQAIATILSNMDREIDDLEIQREKYRAIKSGMMQKLLMGQVRLKTNY